MVTALKTFAKWKWIFWPRLGGRAAFINLYGMEGVTGMYVGEIPAGGALTPEKHFYEEVEKHSEWTGSHGSMAGSWAQADV